MSDTKYLKINLECIHDDECKICANIDIDYVDEENNLCIRFGYCALSDFCYTISKSGKIQELIVGKRIYNKNSIDLGIECNQFFTGRQKKK
ncbi:MAG TPA: hypothetical protein VLG50_06095 [Candidatus Saccharimonadales bacterium]|nr:hypothetical protein [Candidatus Saccharimonadales bacterium]